MASKKEQKQGYGKLLDAWIPQPGAGDPIGCITTTFTFSPVFFEEECLSRFLALETDPNEDGPLYLVEREEKLSQIHAIVLVDQQHCKGSRSLRWDLLSARLPTGVLHAKVSILYWSNCIRVIVASANMTNDGYRRNQEIFGVLEYAQDGDTPIVCLKAVIVFLRKAGTYSNIGDNAESPALDRWNNFLDRIAAMPDSWGSTDERIGTDGNVSLVASGPEYENVMEQLAQIWPAKSSPVRACAMSPFYDATEKTNWPAEKLWQQLRNRGAAQVAFYVTAEEIAGSTDLFIRAPETLLNAQPAGRQNLETSFWRINLETNRPLHAKAIQLQDDRYVMYMIGSSNFTSPGLGLSKRKNLEANLTYIVDGNRNPKAYRSLIRGLPDASKINTSHGIQWQPIPDETEGDQTNILLPAAFASAIYGVDDQKKPTITLVFGKTPPEGWEIRDEDEKYFYSEKEWKATGSQKKVMLAWTSSRPPSGFYVKWKDSKGSVWWTVNVVSQAMLPPPDELKDLPLDVLINILSAARPLHRVLGEYLKKKQRSKERKERFGVDPHTKVDTSRFLLQRTRRVSWALAALRERLERPVASDDGLHWRLRGPIGILELAKALCREGKSEEEKAFLLTELVLELSRVQPRDGHNCLAAAKVKKAIRAVVQEVYVMIPMECLDKGLNLKAYIKSVHQAISL